MFEKPFKSSVLYVLDNTLRSASIVITLIITNITVIINKIKNFDININFIICISFSLFIILNLILNIIKWNNTYISYSNKIITVYKNIVIKNKCEFSIKNISSIVIEESFLGKLFNFCRIKIYVDKINNYRNEVEMIIPKDKCLKLRDIILLDLNKKIFHNLEYEKCNIRISLKNIVLHSIFSISFSQIIVILNVILIVFFAISDSIGIKEILYNLLGTIITVIGVLFPILYHFFKSIFSFYGLCIDRNGDFLSIKYGYFLSKSYIIPISKINGIILNETILSRLFNYVSINLNCSGISDNKNELQIILPMIKYSDVNTFVRKILYDQNYNVDYNYHYQPLKSVYSFIAVILIVNLFILPILILYNISKIYIFILMIVSIISLYFMYYFKRIQLYDTYLVISTGVFLKKKVIIKYEDVQYLKIKKDPLLYKYGISIIKMYITSGLKNKKHTLGYVNYNDTNIILEKCVRQYIY